MGRYAQRRRGSSSAAGGGSGACFMAALTPAASEHDAEIFVAGFGTTPNQTVPGVTVIDGSGNNPVLSSVLTAGTLDVLTTNELGTGNVTITIPRIGNVCGRDLTFTLAP